MSVGIDWTSHALHCGDDFVRARLANNNKRHRESETMMSESLCFISESLLTAGKRAVLSLITTMDGSYWSLL